MGEKVVNRMVIMSLRVAIVICLLGGGCRSMVTSSDTRCDRIRSDTEELIDHALSWIEQRRLVFPPEHIVHRPVALQGSLIKSGDYSGERWLRDGKRIQYLEAGLLLLLYNEVTCSQQIDGEQRNVWESPVGSFPGRPEIRYHPGKYQVLEGLQYVASQASIPHMLILLREEKDKYVREAAVRVIACVGGEDAIPSLCLASRDEDMFVVARVCYTLGNIGGPRAKKCLEEILSRNDLDKQTKQLAETELSNTRKKSGSDPHIQQLNDQNTKE